MDIRRLSIYIQNDMRWIKGCYTSNMGSLDYEIQVRGMLPITTDLDSSPQKFGLDSLVLKPRFIDSIDNLGYFRVKDCVSR